MPTPPVNPRPAFGTLDEAQKAHASRMSDYLQATLSTSGFFSFADFMRVALYAPNLGYYAAGAQKFGADGDFTTAPELTPLFGRTLANAIEPLLDATGGGILELGAGSGALAESILSATPGLARYQILELSAELRARQQIRLARFGRTVEWVDTLPKCIEGVVIANEVLDALPCERVMFRDGLYWQLGVALEGGQLKESRRLLDNAPNALRQATLTRVPPIEGYSTEVGLEAEGLMASVTERLREGVALWIDYGFPRAAFFHEQRTQGTLMCHFQHRAHSDAFFALGLQDITSHVDFTAMAEAAVGAGGSVLGYATQSAFLLAAGLLDELSLEGEPGTRAYHAASNAINRLVNPAEMGELFKVLAITRSQRGAAYSLDAFDQCDQSHRL